MFQHAPKRAHRVGGGGDSADDASGGVESAASSISQAAVFPQASFTGAAMMAAGSAAAPYAGLSSGHATRSAAAGYSHSSSQGHGHSHGGSHSHGHASSSSAASAHHTGVKHLGGLGALQWSEEEDRLLSDAIARYGTDDWTKVAAMVPKRTPQQCMSRWCKALGNEGSRGPWDSSEDTIIREAVSGPTQPPPLADAHSQADMPRFLSVLHRSDAARSPRLYVTRHLTLMAPSHRIETYNTTTS